MRGARRQRTALEAARRLAVLDAEGLERRKKRGPGRSGERDQVVVGRDGWLFSRGDGIEISGRRTRGAGLSRRQRRAWRALIDARMKLVAELGAAWLCSIVPDKARVCSELLPSHVVVADRRRSDDILAVAARLGAPFIDLVDELRAAKAASAQPLYCATNSHWTQFGAFIAYESTCRALRRSGVNLPIVSSDRVRWRTFNTAGGLGSKLDVIQRAVSVRAVVADQRSRLVFDNHVLNHGRTIVFERDDGVGGCAVVFGESSTNYLLAFLKESFRRLVFVHTGTMPREILERERPDVVLGYPSERFMTQVPDDASAMRQIVETIRIKRERGTLRTRIGPYFHGIPGAGEVRNEFELPWSFTEPGPAAAGAGVDRLA